MDAVSWAQALCLERMLHIQQAAFNLEMCVLKINESQMHSETEWGAHIVHLLRCSEVWHVTK